MKISTRLSLAFSFIASTIFVIFGAMVYWFAANHRNTEFFEIITEQFSNTLFQETEEVVEKEADTLTFTYKYPQEVAQNIPQIDSYFFEYGKLQGLSKQFTVNSKRYIIIVTAVDETGIKNLAFLKNRIVLLILIGIPLLLISSFVITQKALLPLTQKIKHANAIGAYNLHQRLHVINSEDEIGKLAIAFNNLLDRLESSFEAQKAFISNASHEIRNPLTAIIGEAEIAASKIREPKEYMESLNHILSEAETLSTTVNNLLQLSKINANEGGVQFEPINLAAFIKEVKASFDFVTPANNIQCLFDANANPVIIKGNKGLLKAALFNVLDNACKFSANQKVKIELAQAEKEVHLIISDKGIGISKSDMANVKAPFYRGNNTFQIKGSGIGLSLTDKIIRLHRGELSIQSELEEGTEVAIILPLA